jgi:hypothetical protein
VGQPAPQPIHGSLACSRLQQGFSENRGRLLLKPEPLGGTDLVIMEQKGLRRDSPHLHFLCLLLASSLGVQHPGHTVTTWSAPVPTAGWSQTGQATCVEAKHMWIKNLDQVCCSRKEPVESQASFEKPNSLYFSQTHAGRRISPTCF